MSARIRGQEVSARFSVDGQPQTGSWHKLTDFTVTPRAEIMETDFIGEDRSDLDFHHHGFDISFSVQNQDAKTLEFLSTLVDRQDQRSPHPNIVMTVIYSFREPGVRDKAEVYQDLFLKVDEFGFGGRKEYVTTRFSGKAKDRSLISI